LPKLANKALSTPRWRNAGFVGVDINLQPSSHLKTAMTDLTQGTTSTFQCDVCWASRTTVDYILHKWLLISLHLCGIHAQVHLDVTREERDKLGKLRQELRSAFGGRSVLYMKIIGRYM
jgi:hypothetical protein